jgi:hypothetical protein
MSLEVYRLTVQIGLARSLDWGRTTNVFYFGVNNAAGLNSYETARDLSAKLTEFIGWLSAFLLLFGIVNRVRKWTIVRFAPTPGAMFDGTLQLSGDLGTGVYSYTQRFTAARVEWLTDDGFSRKAYSQIGWTGENAWDGQEMATFYRLGLSLWASTHADSFTTAAGNFVNPLIRRSGDLFSPIVGYHVVESPGRRITRRVHP